MSNQLLKCPVCGSTDIESGTEHREYPIGFGEVAKLDVVVNRCRSCQESGDFLAASDPAIEAAIVAAEDRLASKSIDVLAAQGYTMASCERALGLAPRTMGRWKSGHISESARVLLKILRTFPWVLEVAKSKFSQSAADHELRRHAAFVQASTTSSFNARGARLVAATRSDNSFRVGP
jgi:hypothetical protein